MPESAQKAHHWGRGACREGTVTPVHRCWPAAPLATGPPGCTCWQVVGVILRVQDFKSSDTSSRGERHKVGRKACHCRSWESYVLRRSRKRWINILAWCASWLALCIGGDARLAWGLWPVHANSTWGLPRNSAGIAPACMHPTRVDTVRVCLRAWWVQKKMSVYLSVCLSVCLSGTGCLPLSWR